MKKLFNNGVNRLDPKFLIIFGNRNQFNNINWQNISFHKLKKLNIKHEKFNSVMMLKHISKDLQNQKIEHFAVERG